MGTNSAAQQSIQLKDTKQMLLRLERGSQWKLIQSTGHSRLLCATAKQTDNNVRKCAPHIFRANTAINVR